MQCEGVQYNVDPIIMNARSKISLELGKRYMMANGKITNPMRIHVGSYFDGTIKANDANGNQYWNADGTVYMPSVFEIKNHTIISEYHEKKTLGSKLKKIYEQQSFAKHILNDLERTITQMILDGQNHPIEYTDPKIVRFLNYDLAHSYHKKAFLQWQEEQEIVVLFLSDSRNTNYVKVTVSHR